MTISTVESLFPSIVTNAAIRRLAYEASNRDNFARWEFLDGRNNRDGLRMSRIARRRATDCSFGSDRSFGWTLMTKAELTAESKPAFENKSEKLSE